MYTLSPAGERAIKNAEGLRLQAYYCAAGKLTIGYGHRVLPGEPLVITATEADKYFEQDANKVLVELSNTFRIISQPEVDGLTSFIFNIGIGAWRGSSARKDAIANMWLAVPTEMKRWVHDDHGNVIPGLVTRRDHDISLLQGKAA